MKFLSTFALAATALFATSCAAASHKSRDLDVSVQAKVIIDAAIADVLPIKEKLLAVYVDVNLNDAGLLTGTIAPLLSELNGVLAGAAGKITSLVHEHAPGGTIIKKRQVNPVAVATALASLVSEVLAAITPLLQSLNGINLVRLLLGSFLNQIGANLNTIAVGLGILVAGVLELVRDLLANLLGGLGGLLAGIGFGGLLSLLGLL